LPAGGEGKKKTRREKKENRQISQPKNRGAKKRPTKDCRSKETLSPFPRGGAPENLVEKTQKDKKPEGSGEVGNVLTKNKFGWKMGVVK